MGTNLKTLISLTTCQQKKTKKKSNRISFEGEDKGRLSSIDAGLETCPLGSLACLTAPKLQKAPGDLSNLLGNSIKRPLQPGGKRSIVRQNLRGVRLARKGKKRPEKSGTAMQQTFNKLTEPPRPDSLGPYLGAKRGVVGAIMGLREFRRNSQSASKESSGRQNLGTHAQTGGESSSSPLRA